MDKKSILKQIKDLIFISEEEVKEIVEEVVEEKVEEIIEEVVEEIEGEETTESNEFLEAQVQGSDIVIKVEGDKFEVGQVVTIVTEEGEIDANDTLDGEVLVPGFKLTILNGVIESVEELKEEATEEDEVEAKVEESFSNLENRINKLEKTIKEMTTSLENFKKSSKEINTKFVETLEDLYENVPAEKFNKIKDLKTDSRVKENKNPINELLSYRRK